MIELLIKKVLIHLSQSSHSQISPLSSQTGFVPAFLASISLLYAFTLQSSLLQDASLSNYFLAMSCYDDATLDTYCFASDTDSCFFFNFAKDASFDLTANKLAPLPTIEQSFVSFG